MTKRLDPLEAKSRAERREMPKALPIPKAFSGARIGVIDVETAPIEAYVWGLFDQNIGLEQIKTEWSILSYAAMWTDRPDKIIYEDTGGRGKRLVRNDRKLMQGIWNFLDEADLIIAQNGKAFDSKKMNARLIEYGFKPPSPYRIIDTLEVAKRYFAFTSRKLAWMADHLTGEQKDEHPEFPGFKLWLECLADNPQAWRVMKKYNIVDIKRTYEVYLQMRPWIENHPNLGMYEDSERPTCPKCGSHRLTKDKYRKEAQKSVEITVDGEKCRPHIKQQGMYIQWKCKDCGGYSRGKSMMINLDRRRSRLVPV